jgi:hypothetical protein
VNLLAHRNLGLLGVGGILGLGLIASVWQLWRGPVLIALFVALLLLSVRVRLNAPGIWFLVVAALVLPLSSLAHQRDVDHFYGLAVFLLLGVIGLLLGFHSSSESIALGVILFQCFLIGFTVWSAVVSPEAAFNSTPYHFGALMGPFGHRNILGAFLGFGMVPLILLPLQRSWLEAVRWTLFGISSILLVATQSLTPVLALGIVAVSFLLRPSSERLSRWITGRTVPVKRLVIAGGATFAAGVVALLVLWVNDVRPTLGSRVLIWEVVVRKLLDEFPFPPAAKWIASGEAVQQLGYNPVHSHNALLGLFLIYGILPTIVFVLAVMAVVVIQPASPAGLRVAPSQEWAVIRGLLIFMVVHSMVENTFLAGPAGVLMVGTMVGLTVVRRRTKYLYRPAWA